MIFYQGDSSACESYPSSYGVDIARFIYELRKNITPHITFG